MTYDTEAIEELAWKAEHFQLPRVYAVSMEDFVISREKGHAWYPCQYCQKMIERSLKYANRKFTCYQCRRDRQKTYDNSPVQVQKRKERRKPEQLGSPAQPLSETEKKSVDSWSKEKPVGIYKRLRRFQKKTI